MNQELYFELERAGGRTMNGSVVVYRGKAYKKRVRPVGYKGPYVRVKWRVTWHDAATGEIVAER